MAIRKVMTQHESTAIHSTSSFFGIYLIFIVSKKFHTEVVNLNEAFMVVGRCDGSAIAATGNHKRHKF
jgi:hypothetical protein